VSDKQLITYILTPSHAQLLAGLVANIIAELELALLQVDPIGKLERQSAVRLTNLLTDYKALLEEMRKQTEEQ